MNQETLNQYPKNSDGSSVPLPLRSPAQRWLASLLLKRRGRLLPRFALFYQQLWGLPRQMRRRLLRKTAATLAGAALLLALGRVPTSDHIAHAATINVDGVTCTLVDAIRSAETDTSYGSCLPGSGSDTIELEANVSLNTSYDISYKSETGLPLISTPITIEGNGHTIERDSGATEKFRLFAVAPSGDLTLNDVTLSGGYAYFYTSIEIPAPYNPPYYVYVNKYYDGDGGAIYSRGTVTISNSTISDNTSREAGGAIRSSGGRLTISDSTFTGNEAMYSDGGAVNGVNTQTTIHNSTFSGNRANEGVGGAVDLDGNNTATISSSTFYDNYAYNEGGAIESDGTITISHSTIRDNEARSDGAGIYVNDTATIQNSTISGNVSGSDGGGVYSRDATLTINNSTIHNNTAYDDSGGLGSEQSEVAITGTTIRDNSARSYGGGLSVRYGSETTITNSTISGNSVTGAPYEYGRGGGIANFFSTMTISNVTITDNTANDQGGGVFNFGDQYEGSLTFVRSLVSGNSAAAGSELYNYDNAYQDPSEITAANHNLFGHDGLTDAQAFVNFAPGATDINATSDGDGVALAAILDGTLADNGGPDSGAPGEEKPILTHALVSGSPAIDDAPNAACNSAPTSGVDQRGYGRNADGDGSGSSNECDIGAYEYNATPAEAVGGIFMTAAGPGTTSDGVTFGKEDILSWDGDSWSKFFDGVDEGLTNKHDVNAIHVNTANDIYLSFFQNKIATVGLGSVFGTDIVRFDGSGFDWYFDGSDVGLATVGKEKIDALHILDGSVSPINGGSCLAYLLISTHGVGQVPQFGGGTINFKGEDILGFCATGLGADTNGHWHMVLDGSTQGMPGNSTDSISATADGGTIYLTTKGKFKVDSAAGGHSMVYEYDTASGSFSGPLFNATANGLTRKADGLHIP